MHVGCGQHPGVVEVAQQASCAGAADVEPIGRVCQRAPGPALVLPAGGWRRPRSMAAEHLGVVAAEHLGRESGWALMPVGELLAGSGEPVGLVVEQGESRPVGAGEADHEVEAAGEKAGDALAQRRVLEAVGIPSKAAPRATSTAVTPAGRATGSAIVMTGRGL